MNPETELRKKLIAALAPEIAVEPVESGAVNPGFPDVLLAVPGADGLFPVELKVGRITSNGVEITYRADQNAKQTELRRRIKCAFTFVYVPEAKHYFLFRAYRSMWSGETIAQAALWNDERLGALKPWLLNRIKR